MVKDMDIVGVLIAVDHFLGIEMYRMVGDRRQGEFKEGKPHGKMTWYRPDGKVYNYVYEEGMSKHREEVTNPRDAWFGDG